MGESPIRDRDEMVSNPRSPQIPSSFRLVSYDNFLLLDRSLDS